MAKSWAVRRHPGLAKLVFVSCALVFAAVAAGAADAPKIEFSVDAAALPEPVTEMRAAILEAVGKADIEALRFAIELNEIPPSFPSGTQGDRIAALKALSADGDGLEVLAQLSLILDGPYARLDPGGKSELYVWPYLAEFDLAKAGPADILALSRIAGGARAKEMRAAGRYDGWRITIGANGVWHALEVGVAVR